MHIHDIAFECRDPYPLAVFWSKVTGFGEDPENRNEPGDPEGLLIAPDGRLRLHFVTADDPADPTGRVRLTLLPGDAPRDVEVERLTKIGAVLVADQRQPGGSGGVVLSDPEGNEFTVLPSTAEGGPPLPEAAAATVVVGAAGPGLWQRLSGAGGTRPDSEEDRRYGPSPAARVARFLSREMGARLRQLIRLLVLVAELLIAVRIILKVAGANQQSGFASFLNRITDPLVGPFHPVFADGSVNGHPFEVGSLLAMAVYAALAYLAARLVRVIVAPYR